MSLLYVDDIRGKTAAASVDLSNATNLKMPAGSIVQTTQTRHTAKSVITSTSFTSIYTCSITPKFATSKILIHVSFSGQHRNYHSGLVRVYRTIGGALTVQGGGLDAPDVGAQWSNVWFNIRKEHEGGTHSDGFNYCLHTYAASHLDSPNTTSAITYSVRGMTTGDTSYGLYVNRTPQNTQAYDSPCASTLTLQEISQ